MLKVILQQSLHQNPKLKHKLQRLLLQSPHFNQSRLIFSSQNRAFSSCHIASYAKGRRPRDEESIFGEDASSGFGGAVPVKGQVPRPAEEPMEESTPKPDTTDAEKTSAAEKIATEKAQQQQQKQKQRREEDEDDDDYTYEVVEDANSNIPYGQIFTYLLAAGALGTIAYVALNYQSIEDYWTHKWTEWRSPVAEIFLPAIPDNVPIEQRKPVLVLNVDDLMVHISYDGIKHGTRTQLRPGLGRFLEEMTKYYEIVLFADSSLNLLMDVYQKLDNHFSFESHKLGSEYTTGMGASIVKDLSRLGRPLSEVVFLEWRTDAFKMQPENVIQMQRWKGRTDDTTLRDLQPFLIALAQVKGKKDFRDVLAEWGNTSKEGGEPATSQHVVEKYMEKIQETQKAQEKQSKGILGRLFSWGS